MKAIILLSAVVIVLMLSACKSSTNSNEQSNSTQTYNIDTTKLKSGETYYQCEMHPEVISDKTGNCPKCEMELIEMTKN